MTIDIVVGNESQGRRSIIARMRSYTPHPKTSLASRKLRSRGLRMPGPISWLPSLVLVLGIPNRQDLTVSNRFGKEI